MLSNELTQTEIGLFPSEWRIRNLGEVCVKVQDGNYGESYPKADELLDSGIPFLTSKAIGKDGVLKEELISHISCEKHRILTKAHLSLNDVLFTNRGASVGAIGFVDQRIQHGNIGPQLTLLRVNPDQVEPRYLYEVMRSALVQRQIVNQDAGSAMNFFGVGDTKKFLLPVPPLAEQRAIAEALSDVDALINALDALITKKRHIKQGTMQQLLTGKKRLPGFSGDWEDERLENLIQLLPSGIFGTEHGTEETLPMPVATTAHITKDDRWNNKQMPQRFFSKKQIDDYAPKHGDLVVVKSSGSAASVQSGKMGFVAEDLAGTFIFSNFLMLLRANRCDSRFLYFQLTSSRVKRMLPNLVEASTYPNIRIDDYLQINVPCPPADEQTAIVSVLSDMDAEITALEQKRDKTKLIKQGMMQELLTGKTRLI